MSVVGSPGLIEPRNPTSDGAASSSFSMRGMANATGSHLPTFHGLLIRIPMRKARKSPSMRAVARLVRISGKG